MEHNPFFIKFNKNLLTYHLVPRAIWPYHVKWNFSTFCGLSKGQLISKCLFEKIVWTKIPPKNLIDSALKYCRAESIKFFGGILVQTIFSKRHFKINWPLEDPISIWNRKFSFVKNVLSWPFTLNCTVFMRALWLSFKKHHSFDRIARRQFYHQ